MNGPRFGGICFNLCRAIEIFADMNHHDMDVVAPPSLDLEKEEQLAVRLQEHLDFLIRDGFFDDCEPRADDELEQGQEEVESEGSRSRSTSSESQDGRSLSMTPESEGFHYSHGSRSSVSGSERNRASSRDTLSSRFKRYVHRILPRVAGNRHRSPSDRSSRRSSSSSEGEREGERGAERHSARRSSAGSRSGSRRASHAHHGH